MAPPPTTRFSLRLTPEQKQKIERLAACEGTSAEEAVLRAVDAALAEAPVEPQPGSFLEAVAEVVGTVEGPPDLSTNARYMDGLGQ